MSEQADFKNREQRLNNYGKSSIMFMENSKQHKKYLYQIDRKSPEYSTQEMTQTEFQELNERKKSYEKESSQSNSKTMFYKLMKNQSNIFSNCLQPQSCVQKTSYCCTAQQPQHLQEEESNFWKLPNSCACISNQNKNEECKEIVGQNYQINQLQLRNFVISPQTNSLRRYLHNTEADQNFRINGKQNIYEEQRDTGFFGSKNNIENSKSNDENEYVAQELKDNERSTIDQKGSFENERIIVQTSSPDMYRRKNQYFDKMIDLQPEQIQRPTRQHTSHSSMSMTQYSTSNLHNQDPSPNNLYNNKQLKDLQMHQNKVNFIYKGSLKKQKMSSTEDENTQEGYTKILTNDFTDKQIDNDPMKEQELYLFNSQFTQNGQFQSNNKTQAAKINVKDLKIDQLIKKKDQTKKELKIQKYKNIKNKQKIEKQPEYIEQRDSSQLKSYRSARKQRIQQILQNTEQSLESYNIFQRNLNYSYFLSTGKKSQEFENIKTDSKQFNIIQYNQYLSDKIERFSYQLQLPLLNGQQQKVFRLKNSINKSGEKDSVKSAMTININQKKSKLENDNISIIDQEAQKLQISKVSIPFSIATKSVNKDLNLQLKSLESISEKKRKDKKHKIKISKKQKTSIQYNDQILITQPDELSKSYEQAINILSSYSALKSPTQNLNSQKSRKKSNTNFQYQTISMPTDCSIYQKVLFQKFKSKRSCSNLIFSIDGYKTSDYNANTKQKSNQRAAEQNYNKKENNRKAFSNQKSQINDKNQLINIQELKLQQNRNLNNTQISINKTKVMNISKNQSNNWNISYRSLRQYAEVKKAGAKKGTAVIIMNLDEDTMHKHHYINSSGKKTNSNNYSERKVSASRCEACRSKSNQKGLDVSRADSNIQRQKINESRIDKSNQSNIKQINEKQQKDIQISMIKFNQMINEEIEKSRLRIEKNSELLMSSTSNINLQNINSSPSIIQQNDAFLASIQHQSPYLTFKQQNQIFENHAFFDNDSNQQIDQNINQQLDNCSQKSPVQSLKLQSKNEGLEQQILNNSEKFDKQKTNIIKNRIPQILEIQKSEINSKNSEKDMQLEDLKTPLIEDKIQEKETKFLIISEKNKINDCNSSETSQAKYQSHDISKFFYPKIENSQQNILDSQIENNLNIEKQEFLRLKKQSNDAQSQDNKQDQTLTDKKQRKKNLNGSLNEQNQEYEIQQKRKWIDFSESSQNIKSVKNISIVQQNTEFSKKQNILEYETLTSKNDRQDKSQNLYSMNQTSKYIPQALNFSQNYPYIVQKEQKINEISQDLNYDEFSSIKLIANKTFDNPIITMINKDNYYQSRNTNQSENNKNRVIEYTSKFTSTIQDNSQKHQNRSIGLEKRIKMFQDSLSEKLSVSCRNTKGKKAQNNLINQQIDLDSKLVLEDKPEITLNRRSIFEKNERSENNHSMLQKIKKHSIIKELSNEVSLRDSLVKNEIRNSVNSNRLYPDIRDSQQSFQLKSLTKSKNDSGNKYIH